jgi:urease accessory protein
MSWLGHLNLDYRLDGDRTIALDRHDGPLRVLQRLYPEGPGICHHVLVHPR